jgi:predicted 2-oxoglutarate/Fe(II)-dependent dioxygenase YbiX
MKIVHKFELVSPRECAAVVECIKSIEHNSGTGEDDAKVLYYSDEKIIETSDFIYGLLCDVGDRVRAVAEELFATNLSISQIAIFKTVPGHTPEEHADSQNMDGSPKDGCSDFIASAIVYFNDDFDGGELIFPKMPYSYSPVAGSCILFPSDISHSHYVNHVISGERIVLPLWFSLVV